MLKINDYVRYKKDAENYTRCTRNLYLLKCIIKCENGLHRIWILMHMMIL
nr:MAG TPA: hypothetical protein [Caudoviricetes sp.]